MPQSIMMPVSSHSAPQRRIHPYLYTCIQLLLCGLMLTVFSCKNEEQPPIPIAKMSNILFDLQTAEDYSIGNFKDSIKQNSIEKNNDTLAYYYALTLKHHAVSAEALEDALNWYYEHPVVMDSVYKRVIDKANKYKTLAIKDTTSLVIQDSVLNAATAGLQDSNKLSAPAATPKPDFKRPERATIAPMERSEDQELKDIKKKNKDIKETLDKVKKQGQ
ncbi:hypothetical protein DBR32_06080 [Taibaiella sp. KBW10]|uniref:DUF4296 domain-containing protein n=1 Tax=Taibaiella sp. KBW10 TaxID=2153357 RepID=UPI000F5A4ACB|nr:DUF4296 domain-containing protein [Taibaiella sp. KBW10]RQO31522.1 hypothetical protein DBR32_06080 [Taibaiella sp. KBW10]